jgi:CcmD family protein
MENLIFLFAAYTIVWIVVFGYIFFLHRKERRLWRMLNLLRERIDKDIPR